MPDTNQILDAVVIGAGWAGLGISDALRAKGLSHRILEHGRIGETWRTQRWDSFRMNTPNVHAVMPGDRYAGQNPEGVMTRDEFVALLEDFAARKRLPLELYTPVTELMCDQESGIYRVSTPRSTFLANNAVIATGNLNCPVRPVWSSELPPEICQIDASEYRNANCLNPGAVLVVGSGQSGGQIAEDLIKAKRSVFLATSRVGRKPRRYRGRDLSLWLEESGSYDKPRTDEALCLKARPLVGADHTISLQSLSAQGVTLLGRFTGVERGKLRFADTLSEIFISEIGPLPRTSAKLMRTLSVQESTHLLRFRMLQKISMLKYQALLFCCWIPLDRRSTQSSGVLVSKVTSTGCGCLRS